MRFQPLTPSNRTEPRIQFHNGSADRCGIILHNFICKFIIRLVLRNFIEIFTLTKQILHDASFTSAQQQSEQACEGDISGVQLETNMEADTHTSDISRSACEECNKHKQRYIRLNDKYRKAKGVQQKLKSKVVQLEKANEALTEVNSMF